MDSYLWYRWYYNYDNYAEYGQGVAAADRDANPDKYYVETIINDVKGSIGEKIRNAKIIEPKEEKTINATEEIINEWLNGEPKEEPVTPVVPVSSEKNGTVAITKKTEVVFECKIIYISPITVNKSRNQEKKSTLRLMEISYKHIDDTEGESRYDYNPGTDFQLIQTIGFQVVHYSPKSLFRRI